MISSNYYRIDVCFFFGVNARNQKTAPRVRGFLLFCFEASIRQSFYFFLYRPDPLFLYRSSPGTAEFVPVQDTIPFSVNLKWLY